MTGRERITEAARRAGWTATMINGHRHYIEYRRGRRSVTVYYDSREGVRDAGFTTPTRALLAPTRDTADHIIGFLYAVPGARFESAQTGGTWTVTESVRISGTTYVRFRTAPCVIQSVPLNQFPAQVGRWIGVPA